MGNKCLKGEAKKKHKKRRNSLPDKSFEEVQPHRDLSKGDQSFEKLCSPLDPDETQRIEEVKLEEKEPDVQIEVEDIKIKVSHADEDDLIPEDDKKQSDHKIKEEVKPPDNLNSLKPEDPLKSPPPIKPPVQKPAPEDKKGEEEEPKNVLEAHQQKYAVDSNRDNYFTPEQLEYYDQKFKNEEQITCQSYVKEWKKLEEIGRGSFGYVYSGIDSIKGRPIAVKQVALRKEKKSEAGVDTLELEIDCLSRLNHKNIVAYYGCQKHEDQLDIFLEYVGGGSLESALKEYGGLSERIIKKYTKQILDGLEYLHYKKMIHRDIKAANILVNKGVCKLTDFGASKKILNDMKQEKFKSFIGTPYWMAPEVITQQGHGRFADIWSLGCTVYEMLTSTPPFSECNEFAAMTNIVKNSKPPKYPEGISPELEDFLNCCFKKNPSDRLNTYELQQHPFLKDDSGKRKNSVPKKSTEKNTEKKKINYREDPPSNKVNVMKPKRKVTFHDSDNAIQSGQTFQSPQKRGSILKNPLNKMSNFESLKGLFPSPQSEEKRSFPVVLENHGRCTKNAQKAINKTNEIQDRQKMLEIAKLILAKHLTIEDGIKLISPAQIQTMVALIAKESTVKQAAPKPAAPAPESPCSAGNEQYLQPISNQDENNAESTRRKSYTDALKSRGMLSHIVSRRDTEVKCIQEEYSEEEKASTAFQHSEIGDINMHVKSKKSNTLVLPGSSRVKSSFVNQLSQASGMSPSIGTSDRDGGKFHFEGKEVIEEEHKMSHHSSSMNESDFDNFSSASSVSSDDARTYEEDKNVQRMNILKEIKLKVTGHENKSNHQSGIKPEERALKQIPILEEGKNMGSIPSQNLRENKSRQRSFKTGNLAFIDKYRKSDKKIMEISETKLEKSSSLNEDDFDNMSDSCSSDEEEDVTRVEIEKQIKKELTTKSIQ